MEEEGRDGREAMGRDEGADEVLASGSSATDAARAARSSTSSSGSEREENGLGQTYHASPYVEGEGTDLQNCRTSPSPPHHSSRWTSPPQQTPSCLPKQNLPAVLRHGPRVTCGGSTLKTTLSKTARRRQSTPPFPPD